MILTKTSKTIGKRYRARLMILSKQLNHLYFLFVQNYLNYANLVWCSTHKTKLSTLYLQQKHTIRLLSLKDHLRHSRPLKEISALNVYELNTFDI